MSQRDPHTPKSHGATPKANAAAPSSTARIEIADQAVLVALCGPRNEHQRTLEGETGVAIGQRGNQVRS